MVNCDLVVIHNVPCLIHWFNPSFFPHFLAKVYWFNLRIHGIRLRFLLNQHDPLVNIPEKLLKMVMWFVDFPVNSMVIFHSYVSIPEGMMGDQLTIEHGRRNSGSSHFHSMVDLSSSLCKHLPGRVCPIRTSLFLTHPDYHTNISLHHYIIDVLSYHISYHRCNYILIDVEPGIMIIYTHRSKYSKLSWYV